MHFMLFTCLPVPRCLSLRTWPLIWKSYKKTSIYFGTLSIWRLAKMKSQSCNHNLRKTNRQVSMENEQWDEATVPTDGPVGYRQQRLPSSLQILNPRQKFPFSCFTHHHFLNHLHKCRFEWRPFETLATTYRKETTTSFPWIHCCYQP